MSLYGRQIGFSVATMLVMLAVAAPASASFPGQNGKIAVTDGQHIFVMNPDGSGRTQLTTGVTTDRAPAWSPDGRKIAFERSSTGVAVMDADGTGVDGLGEGSSPAWSPDGTRIAFSSSSSGIWVMNSDGTNRQQLTGFGVQPSWSPDGREIAFSYDEPDYCCPMIRFPSHLFLVGVDGTGARVLTPASSSYLGDFLPDWSPDGSQIAYICDELLCTVRPDGSTGTVFSFAIEVVESVDWSPDGRKVVFRANTWDGSPSQGRIYTVDSDSSGLTATSSNDFDPDWQPILGPRRADYNNGAHFCEAERDFFGSAEFAARYGGGASAFGRCVSSTASDS